MPRSLDPRVYTNELLERALTPEQGQRILTLGVEGGAVLTFARAVGRTGRVAAIEPWLPEWRRLRQESTQERVPWAEPLFAARLDDLGDATFDAVAVDISSFPSARALLAIVAEAAQRLVPGGTIFVAGARNQGIISFGKRLEAMLGNATTLQYRKGQRVIAAARTSELHLPDLHEVYAPYTATLHGVTLELERDPGVFARGEVDDATAMLAEAMEIRPDDRVVDPGCGAGILGLVAARLAPAEQVVMTDAYAGALDLARRHAARNDAPNVRIEAADILDTVADERFTVAICNPPFHEHHEQPEGSAPITAIADRFIQAIAAVLLPGGRLYFVANRFLAYESRIAAVIGPTAEVAGDKRYKVLLATKAVGS